MVKSFNTKHSVLVIKSKAESKHQMEKLLQKKVNQFRLKGGKKKNCKLVKNIKYSPHNTSQFIIGKQFIIKDEPFEDYEVCSGSMLGKLIIGQNSLISDKENWSTMDEYSLSEASF